MYVHVGMKYSKIYKLSDEKHIFEVLRDEEKPRSMPKQIDMNIPRRHFSISSSTI